MSSGRGRSPCDTGPRELRLDVICPGTLAAASRRNDGSGERRKPTPRDLFRHGRRHNCAEGGRCGPPVSDGSANSSRCSMTCMPLTPRRPRRWAPPFAVYAEASYVLPRWVRNPWCGKGRSRPSMARSWTTTHPRSTATRPRRRVVAMQDRVGLVDWKPQVSARGRWMLTRTDTTPQEVRDAVEVRQRQEREAVRGAEGQGHVERRAAKIANSPKASKHGGEKSHSGSGKSNQGGTTAQHKAAGRKGGKATAAKRK